MEPSRNEAVFPAPEPEVFRRVWERVMPEQAPPSPCLPAPASGPKPDGPVPPPDCHFLTPLLELTARQASAFRALAQRDGAAARSLSALAADSGEDFRRLSAAHFLITGQRYRPSPPPPPPRRDFLLALRDRWLECIRLGVSCERILKTTEDPALSKLLQQVRQRADRRADALRTLLEKRCFPP